MTDLHADLTDGPGTDSPGEELGAAQVEDLLRALSSAVRSYRLYAGNGPMLERFVGTLRDKVRALWEHTDRLRLELSEHAMHWEGRKVFPTGDATGELAFSFYKDGIRTLTLLPGMEDEVERLLSVLGRAPQVREEEDDLITLLWQENFTALKYENVELVPEGPDLGVPTGAPAAPVDPQAVREAAQTPDATPALRPEDFQDTLHFLDDAELRHLQAEVRKEAERDLWRDVLAALFDRLEDGSPERQLRIIHLLREVLPSMLASAAFDRAVTLLGEVSQLAGRPGALSPDALRQVREVFEQLAHPETIDQLVQTLEDSPDALRGEGLTELMNFFPPSALAPLIRALEAVNRPDLKRALEGAAQRLAEGSRDTVVRLLSDSDPVVATGAARWVGSLGIGSATGELVRLLRRPEAQIRLAAVDALVALRAAVAGDPLLGLLEDPEREVRIAAARALGALEYAAARGVLEAVLDSKQLRGADRSEKIAFFEAYGRVGGAQAVAYLDKALNGKSWLGRGEPAEIRACAALGLARIRHPSAHKALTSAANDSDPVVRTAVARALRGEAS